VDYTKEKKANEMRATKGLTGRKCMKLGEFKWNGVGLNVLSVLVALSVAFSCQSNEHDQVILMSF
jgi:hypothetical protein